jgi:hypothetical protein
MLVKRLMISRQIILAGILSIILLSSTGTVVALGNSSPFAYSPDTISGTITLDNGLMGPESPMFGLKVAWENLDETFTFNDTRRVEKQAGHAQARIAEVQRELELNRTDSAEQVLELYRQKLNQTEMSLLRFQADEPGLLNAQELIAEHQILFADLVSRYPGSTGLAHAYNNNLILEQKFGEKTRIRFDRVVEKNNKTILKSVKLENKKQNNTGENNSTSAGSTGQGRNETKDQIKDKKDDIPVNSSGALSRPAPSDDKGSSKGQGKKGTG